MPKIGRKQKKKSTENKKYGEYCTTKYDRQPSDVLMIGGVMKRHFTIRPNEQHCKQSRQRPKNPIIKLKF